MNIIGQKNLKNQIDTLISNNFPRFSLIHGPKGGGKKLFAEYIAKQLNVDLVWCGIKVEDVRQTIQLAYVDKVPALYVFADADNMSTNAKNALLKITEEPPTNSYILMTVSDKSKTLNTIISRAVIFNIDPYSNKDIAEYIKENNITDNKLELEIISEICSSPGEVSSLISYNIKTFYDFCEQVIDNIAEVEGSNAFKIALKLDTKGDGNLYDISLFLKTISLLALKKFKETEDVRYNDVIRVCSKYKQELSITGINKLMLIDEWILAMRRAL